MYKTMFIICQNFSFVSALRYAVLVIKYGIGKILLNHNIKLNPKTEFPIKLKPNAIVNTPEKTLLFDLEEVN